MPFFFKFSAGLLLTSLVGGQLWLHDAASPSAIASARSSLSACPALGSRDVTSQWDVIRVRDAVWTARLARMARLGSGCGD
jgi:hypothetical protein